MKARILDPQVKVYSSLDANAVSIATLGEGNEVDVGTPKRKAGKLWLPITLSTGQQAYISGDTHLFPIRMASLMQNNVDMHTEPSANSAVKRQLVRNTRVYVMEVVKRDDQDWVKVRDMTGTEGYIAGNTGLRVVQERTKAMGRRNIFSGLMWLIAGLIVVFSSGSPAVSGGFALFAIIALGFGAVIFIMGLIQLLTAKS